MSNIVEKYEQSLTWFFGTPTAIVGVITISVALFAYKFQRQENRKVRAQNIAKLYAEEIIPTMRFINEIMERIGATKYIKFFCDFKKFDGKESDILLDKAGITKEEFEKLFQKIDKDMIRKVALFSRVAQKELLLYNEIDDFDCSDYARVFNCFVIDFLNKLEAFAILLKYNVADEKIIYQALHQTFIKNMPQWYFFIARHNTLDENRYYDNVIWLFDCWSKRQEKQSEKTYKQMAAYRGRKL